MLWWKVRKARRKLGSSKKEERLQGVEELSKIGGMRVASALIAGLRSHDRDVRLQILMALAGIRGPLDVELRLKWAMRGLSDSWLNSALRRLDFRLDFIREALEKVANEDDDAVLRVLAAAMSDVWRSNSQR